MALAVLRLLHSDDGQINFKIDTGTNKYYYLKVGRSLTDINGVKWADDIIGKTRLKENKASSSFYDSSFTERIDRNLFSNDICYVQLFSFKTKDGISPGFSKVVKVNTGFFQKRRISDTFSISNVQNEITMSDYNISQFRNVPHYDAGSVLSKQSSLEDILAGVIRVAGPIVMGLLNGSQSAGGAAPAAAGSPAAPSLGMFNTLIDSLLRGLAAPGSAPAAAPVASAAPAPAAAAPARQQSVSMSFSNGDHYAHPFIFGIDDAILASLVGSVAGPVLQVIPQLLSANNQAKLQNHQLNNRMITDLVADVNRRMMMQDFLRNQQPGASPNLQQLLALLQQMPASDSSAIAPIPPIDPIPPIAPVQPAAPAAAAAARPATSGARSLSVAETAPLQTVSDKTVLSFEHGAKQQLFGKDRNIYRLGAPIKLRVKFNVTEPAPKTPLPKAIIKVIFRDDKHNTLFEKLFKQKDVLPNSVIELSIIESEITRVPLNVPVQVFAEMRWLTSQNREYKTMGNSELVLTNGYFIKEQGKFVYEEKELTDMNVYRSFWNKIWESPVIDKINESNDGTKKFGWELDGNLKYSIVLSADHDSNGLMNTKKLVAEKDPDKLTDIMEARMKGGIELSISQLNKMSSMWDKRQPLPNDKLAAFKTQAMVQNNAGELIYNIKLKGKKAERGIIWIVPVLKLANFTLSKIKNTDANGQITEVDTEEVQFPLPFAARILGLKSK